MRFCGVVEMPVLKSKNGRQTSGLTLNRIGPASSRSRRGTLMKRRRIFQMANERTYRNVGVDPEAETGSRHHHDV